MCVHRIPTVSRGWMGSKHLFRGVASQVGFIFIYDIVRLVPTRSLRQLRRYITSFRIFAL